MNKDIALALGTIFSLSVANTGVAAPANLFAVIPEHHWSYSAVGELAKSGIVNGFGGGVYQEDVILTRCEMATIVAKAMAKSERANAMDKATIEKLQVEFAPELSMNMGSNNTVDSRLEKLEKSKPMIKMTGDARIRYQTNWNQGAKNIDSKNTTRMQERIRLNFTSDVADNLTFFGRLNATNTSNQYKKSSDSAKASQSTSPTFERGELQWQNEHMTTSVGRFLPFLGQGLIWDSNAIDGVMTTYDFGNTQLSVGYGDLSAYTVSGSTTNAFIANLKVKVADNTNVTVAHLNTMTNAIGYNFDQTAYGFNTKSNDFTITGEYVKNTDSHLPANAQDHGYWGRVLWKGIDNSKPGTFGISIDYLNLGNYAVDSTNNPGTLVINGGNGIGGDGAQGYGLGMQYVFAKNANVEARYYHLKPYDSSTFSDYKPSYHLITNFKF